MSGKKSDLLFQTAWAAASSRQFLMWSSYCINPQGGDGILSSKKCCNILTRSRIMFKDLLLMCGKSTGCWNFQNHKTKPCCNVPLSLRWLNSLESGLYRDRSRARLCSWIKYEPSKSLFRYPRRTSQSNINGNFFGLKLSKRNPPKSDR